METNPDRGPLAQEVGGEHYKNLPIQPVVFIEANSLGFIEGNIVKYACRHRHKGGAEDVRKIIHYAELLLALCYGEGGGEAPAPAPADCGLRRPSGVWNAPPCPGQRQQPKTPKP